LEYQLLQRFRELFDGTLYRHRDASLGDSVAIRLFEDLYHVRKSEKLNARIETGRSILNVQNVLRGKTARRGDGTFGEAVPNASIIREDGFAVARGQIATVEIGVEVKILAKAMIKQVDRVMTVMENQAQHFRRGGGSAICIGVVGVNYADRCTSYEGDREYPTDGRGRKHPCQEAPEAEKRIAGRVAPKFDEFLVLRFRARNVAPFDFEWVDCKDTELDYGAILTRVCRDYDRRF
jgi:hypothetical protein